MKYTLLRLVSLLPRDIHVRPCDDHGKKFVPTGAKIWYGDFGLPQTKIKSFLAGDVHGLWISIAGCRPCDAKYSPCSWRDCGLRRL